MLMLVWADQQSSPSSHDICWDGLRLLHDPRDQEQNDRGTRGVVLRAGLLPTFRKEGDGQYLAGENGRWERALSRDAQQQAGESAFGADRGKGKVERGLTQAGVSKACISRSSGNDPRPIEYMSPSLETFQ